MKIENIFIANRKMTLPPYNRQIGGLLGPRLRPRRKVFISYHHRNDQGWYDRFSTLYSSNLELFSDNSLDRVIDSDNSEYLNRTIREECIFGSSITIVLCGAETGKRRWVDWEIYSTLYCEHALLGLVLPTCSRSSDNKYIVPTRLHYNIESGYARWILWTENAQTLSNSIEDAIRRSSQKNLIRNSEERMKRSLS